MIELKLFSKEDYEMLCKWWTWHKWPIVPKFILPKNGLIVYRDKVPMCAGFLYLSDSKVSWVEFIVSAPETDKESRNNCLDILVEELVKLSKLAGCSFVFTSTVKESLVERYKKHGFQIGDVAVTHLIHSGGETWPPHQQ